MFDATGEPCDGQSCALPVWLDLDLYGLEEFDETTPDWSDLLAEAAAREPGPWLMTGLASLDPSTLSPNDAVTYVQQWERAAAWVAGMKAAATADAFAVLLASQSEPEGAGSGFVIPEAAAAAELAAALHVAPRTADKRVQQALDLAGPTEPLRAAMLRGDLAERHRPPCAGLGEARAAGFLCEVELRLSEEAA